VQVPSRQPAPSAAVPARQSSESASPPEDAPRESRRCAESAEASLASASQPRVTSSHVFSS